RALPPDGRGGAPPPRSSRGALPRCPGRRRLRGPDGGLGAGDADGAAQRGAEPGARLPHSPRGAGGTAQPLPREDRLRIPPAAGGRRLSRSRALPRGGGGRLSGRAGGGGSRGLGRPSDPRGTPRRGPRPPERRGGGAGPRGGGG